MSSDSPDQKKIFETEFRQADLYEDLRRIGELEDQKQKIQEEIDELTTNLTDAIPKLDTNSLLFQMLSTTFKPAPKPKVAGAKTATKTSSRAGAKSAASKSAPKKKAPRKKKA